MSHPHSHIQTYIHIYPQISAIISGQYGNTPPLCAYFVWVYAANRASARAHVMAESASGAVNSMRFRNCWSCARMCGCVYVGWPYFTLHRASAILLPYLLMFCYCCCVVLGLTVAIVKQLGVTSALAPPRNCVW